jgi:DNA-binding CsgD family transcriptional regulator
LPYPTFTQALSLPTFEIAGMTLIKRLTLIVDHGSIVKVFYPVVPPEQNATEVLHWLSEHPQQGTAPLATVDCAGYERVAATARAHLGEQAFAAAWAEGHRITPEQASMVLYQASPPELGPEAPHPPQLAAPTDLTAREMEVLRLLARGLTNAQIAEELVVSLLTVKAHLRSIYSKLGVTSRSAATRYALEHHLD